MTTPAVSLGIDGFSHARRAETLMNIVADERFRNELTHPCLGTYILLRYRDELFDDDDDNEKQFASWHSFVKLYRKQCDTGVRFGRPEAILTLTKLPAPLATGRQWCLPSSREQSYRVGW